MTDPILIILDALSVAPDVIEGAANLIRLCTSSGRDPTPEEIADLKSKVDQVNEDWAAGRPSN